MILFVVGKKKNKLGSDNMYIPTLNNMSLVEISSFPKPPFIVVASMMTFVKLMVVAPLVTCSKDMNIGTFAQSCTVEV
jgi:hypothetical protein